MTDKMFSFKTALQEQPITINDQRYTLRELTGAQRDRYMDEMSGRMIFGADGKAKGLSKLGGLDTLLLSLSLVDPEGVLVKSSAIAAWPTTVVEGLAKISRELSGIGPDKEAPAKNDSEASD